jgi:DNA-binding response OmpR family regulator
MTLQASGAAPARVVLIEDSEPIRQMISIYLTNNGMKVFEADTVSAGRRAVNLLKPQIVLLDLGLEDGDGIDLLPEIVNQKIPCLVISARSQALDRVISLEKGAHDYMTKPIELRELLLRMRRTMSMQAVAASPNDTIWAFGEIRVDQALRAIVTANGSKNVPITAMEFKLLRIFTSRAGRVVDRAELAKVIGVRSVEVSRALDISVSRLRKKLRDAGYEVNLRSVRGSGYLFSADQAGTGEPLEKATDEGAALAS